MAKTLMKYCKDKSAKWLLAAVMLLSVFAFSGYSNHSALLHKAKARTELVCSAKAKHKKFTVLFTRVIYSSDRYPFFNYFRTHWTTLLLSYSTLIKVKFDNISKQYKSIDQADKFVQVKNIPSNSSKDIFIAIG
ncbi:MAG: hypothetical protein QM687_08765 [Ferruginibacter sp.]